MKYALQRAALQLPSKHPHLTHMPSKLIFWKWSWSWREGEALGKGTFGNEGTNLSLGSLLLYPSSATSSHAVLGAHRTSLVLRVPRGCGSYILRVGRWISHSHCPQDHPEMGSGDFGGTKQRALVWPAQLAASSRNRYQPPPPPAMLRQAPWPPAPGVISATLWWTGLFWCTAVFF